LYTVNPRALLYIFPETNPGDRCAEALSVFRVTGGNWVPKPNFSSTLQFLRKKFLVPIVEKVLLLFKVHPHLNSLPSMAYIAAECRKYFVATQRELTVWVYSFDCSLFRYTLKGGGVGRPVKIYGTYGLRPSAFGGEF
jgi:hypothetical protein